MSMSRFLFANQRTRIEMSSRLLMITLPLWRILMARGEEPGLATKIKYSVAFEIKELMNVPKTMNKLQEAAKVLKGLG